MTWQNSLTFFSKFLDFSLTWRKFCFSLTLPWHVATLTMDPTGNNITRRRLGFWFTMTTYIIAKYCFSVPTISECKNLEWIWLQQVRSECPIISECPLSPTTQLAFIEWQSTIRRCSPPSQNFWAKRQNQPLRSCLHVTFKKNGLLLFSIVSMNNGQKGSVTHPVYYSARHHWHNVKQITGRFF